MVELGGSGSEAPVERRVVKRYSNRKLYDTKDSRYVTLLQIAEIIRAGEDVQIIDNSSKEDKTDVTLALIISEELRTQPRAIPLSTLKSLIRDRGDRLLTHLRIRPIGRLLMQDPGERQPADPDDPRDETETSDALRDAPAGGRERPAGHESPGIQELLTAVRRLSERLDAVEDRLAERDRPKG